MGLQEAKSWQASNAINTHCTLSTDNTPGTAAGRPPATYANQLLPPIKWVHFASSIYMPHRKAQYAHVDPSIIIRLINLYPYPPSNLTSPVKLIWQRKEAEGFRCFQALKRKQTSVRDRGPYTTKIIVGALTGLIISSSGYPGIRGWSDAHWRLNPCELSTWISPGPTSNRWHIHTFSVISFI